ncbi:MAG: class I SAM-dependent methyltransferase [Oscillochloris sp.]|nr:class I SAM-dependent methyltransferase [Oscillochloris sp.]
MSQWHPSAQYRKIAEANRQYYAKTAQLYDSTETCVTDMAVQSRLEGDLDAALALIGKPHSAIHALDACGGSGNVSLKMLRRGVGIVTCDISVDLLRIFQARCDAEGLTSSIVCSEIGDFLLTHPGCFDLIIFSSALHHLEDVHGVLDLAYRCLAPGGVIYTSFDPTAWRNEGERLIVYLDYVAFKIHRQPGDLLAALSRRARRALARATSKGQVEITEANLGILAEYHVAKGIDDMTLVARLRERGAELIRHEREVGGRYGVTRALLRAMGAATTFRLMLRKPIC